MKYRHSFHAGNFADVHKHVTLLAVLEALKRKDKGFLYLETHAGRGAYDLADSPGGRNARSGLARLLDAAQAQPEITQFAQAVGAWRDAHGRGAYPGSPVLAAEALRAQDRAVLIELQPPEAHALQRALGAGARARARVEIGDGYERSSAHLPPRERRGLVLVDPPYEETGRDFERVCELSARILQRFATAVVMLWYPIKDVRDTNAWRRRLAGRLESEILVSELWVHPCDSRVALNGSGLLILNAPYRLAERMQTWLPALHAQLDEAGSGGSLVAAAQAG